MINMKPKLTSSESNEKYKKKYNRTHINGVETIWCDLLKSSWF